MVKVKNRKKLCFLLVLVCLVLAACDGGEEGMVVGGVTSEPGLEREGLFLESS